jgi:YVTN family beta-propeller protein
MKQRMCRQTIICMVMTLGMISFMGQAQAEAYRSPVAMAYDGSGLLYVADATANVIYRIDVQSQTVKDTIKTAGAPSGLCLAGSAYLFVTSGIGDGQLEVFNIEGAAPVAETGLPLGHSPIAPVMHPQEEILYVCDRFANAVLVITNPDAPVISAIPVSREPIAAVISPDGARLFVVNHLPAGAADAGYASAVISVIDTATKTVVKEIQLPNGSTALRGLCLSPDGKYAYVSHILARYQLPTTQLERGWMNTNALSVIDTQKQERVNTVLLDSVDLGAANPWGVAASADGAWLAVAHSGTHEISVIDRPALHEKLDKVAAGEAVSEVSQEPEDVPNDLAFMVNIRRRVRLTGEGPRALSAVGSNLWAGDYFSASLEIIALSADERLKAASMSLGAQPEPDQVRQGEALFHNARICFQMWQSCSSCHPDVRVDGLNWDLLNDGMGNPKNTKSLVLSHVTPPAMITGIRADAETAVRAGIRHIQFAVRPEEDALALDAFLKSLEPLPSPALEKGQLSEGAQRGKTVFEKAACVECHPGPNYTDLKLHDVGTGKGREANIALDTPTLRENWRTGPYLHDGRAATLEQVVREYNEDDKHGLTKALSFEEITDLVEYMESL